jgi:hypothetical protein
VAAAFEPQAVAACARTARQAALLLARAPPAAVGVALERLEAETDGWLDTLASQPTWRRHQQLMLLFFGSRILTLAPLAARAAELGAADVDACATVVRLAVKLLPLGFEVGKFDELLGAYASELEHTSRGATALASALCTLAAAGRRDGSTGARSEGLQRGALRAILLAWLRPLAPSAAAARGDEWFDAMLQLSALLFESFEQPLDLGSLAVAAPPAAGRAAATATHNLLGNGVSAVYGNVPTATHKPLARPRRPPHPAAAPGQPAGGASGPPSGAPLPADDDRASPRASSPQSPPQPPARIAWPPSHRRLALAALVAGASRLAHAPEPRALELVGAWLRAAMALPLTGGAMAAVSCALVAELLRSGGAPVAEAVVDALRHASERATGALDARAGEGDGRALASARVLLTTLRHVRSRSALRAALRAIEGVVLGATAPVGRQLLDALRSELTEARAGGDGAGYARAQVARWYLRLVEHVQAAARCQGAAAATAAWKATASALYEPLRVRSRL